MTRGLTAAALDGGRSSINPGRLIERRPPRVSRIALGRQLVTRFPRGNGSRIDGMPRITRERMIEAIRELPEDASVDDAIERLVFLAKIEEGLAQLDRGEGIPHDKVKQRLGL